MTIERIGRTGRQVVCDDCGDTQGPVYHEDEFSQMIEDAKTAGWTIRPDGEGGWEHFCPDDAPGDEDRLARARRLLGD